MAEAYFEQDIFILAPPEDVRSFLATMENHLQIHPLVVGIRLIDTAATPDGVPIRKYAIRDRMRLGPFTVGFTYQTTLQVGPEGELVLDAAQFPGIRLHNIFRFHPEGAGTRVLEEVNIQASSLLIKTVFEQAQQSHRHMWLNLKKVLEERGLPS